MKQRELIESLSSKELTKAIYLSQSLFFSVGIILYFIFINDISVIKGLLQFDGEAIFYYGILFALALVVIEIILYRSIPKEYFDDGGINEKVFQNQSILSIFFIALTVAIAEEFLFRGVIQTVFGYVFASSLFVIMHTRYLKKPVLLVLLIGTSFFIGYLFELTNNLLVTIVFHFVVDFTLGLYIKFNKWGGLRERT